MARSISQNDVFQRDDLGVECKHLLVTAACCATVGACGLWLNHVVPGSTHLDGLMVVGIYYGLRATAKFFAVA